MPSSFRSTENAAALIAVTYFGAYMAYLFGVGGESEATHWATLVAAPTLLAWASLERRRSIGTVLSQFGLQRGRLRKGLPLGVTVGLVLSAAQLLLSRNSGEILGILLSAEVLYLLPLSFLLMLVAAGFTEEFFFRGFLQTRITNALGRTWPAIVIVALLFGAYHLPYAYLNPSWPSAGNWGAAFGAAFGQGVPAGLILGWVYARSNNLLAPVIAHSLINTLPVMVMLSN